MSENQEIPTMIEMLGTIPAKPKRERLWKTLHDKYPGHISLMNDRNSINGVRAAYFVNYQMPIGLEENDHETFLKELTEGLEGEAIADKLEEMHAVDYLNAYWATRANLAIVDKVLGEHGIMIFYTTQLDEDDLEEMTEFQRRVNVDMEGWHEERYNRQQEQLKALAEQKRLATVGKTVEEQNVIGQLRAAQEKIKSLTRQLNDLEAADES